jgi:ssDNA-binding replication factor A large subunit
LKSKPVSAVPVVASAQSVPIKVEDKKELNPEVKQKISQVLGNVSDVYYTPIKTLNTFNFDWKIKARVTKKHPKRPWKNAKTEGSVFNIELMDNEGT